MRFETVETSKIVTGEYQRELQHNRVARIVARFKPEKLGVILLSDRGDGTYAVLDGQHRVAAVRQMNIERIYAAILEGLTVEEEADIFRTQNENVTPPNAIDQYRAGIVAKDPHYLTIKAILDKHGYAVSGHSLPYQVRAVGTLTWIVRQYGFAVLDKTFEYIKTAWAADVSAIQRVMLILTAEFAARYSGEVTAAQFAARMAAEHPSALAYEFNGERLLDYAGKSVLSPVVREMGCRIMVNAFNKGLDDESGLCLKMENRQVA